MMNFKDKYTAESEKNEPKNKEKKLISDDAFALGDIIQNLIDKIEHARASIMK